MATNTIGSTFFAMPGVPKLVLIILVPVELMGIILKPMVLMLRLLATSLRTHNRISNSRLNFYNGKIRSKYGGATAGGLIAFPILLFVKCIRIIRSIFTSLYIYIVNSNLHWRSHRRTSYRRTS